MTPIHEDPGLFREALTLTRERTGFSERLIEKDYFCSLMLERLAGTNPELIFKGGTCLAKVHADFYRLSEDLDFVIPMPLDATRARRSKEASSVRQTITALPQEMAIFRVSQPLTGANNSTQYNAIVTYKSLVTGAEENLKIEIGLREPLHLDAIQGKAKTILLDPVSGQPIRQPIPLPCIAKQEAYAEKFRAALSRRDVAVRDFFDLDYAVRKYGLNTDKAELVDLVKMKLSVPNNPPINVSEERQREVERQVDPQLRPVLRDKDFAEFDLERAFQIAAGMARKLQEG